MGGPGCTLIAPSWRRSLTNLVANAVRFTPAVRVDVTVSDGPP